MKSDKGIGFYLRLVISVLLIFYVFHKVDLKQLWEAIRHADWLYILLSVSITPVLILISSWKWHVILRAQGVHVSIWRLFWLYMVGYFFNTVLPTNVGGDVVRAYALGKSTGDKAKAFASVFIERFTGLTALLFMAVVAFFVAIRSLWDVWLGVAMAISLLGYFILLAIIFNQRYLSWLEKKISIGIFIKILRKLQKFQQATRSVGNQKATIIFALTNSFLFYFAAVVNVYISSLAFNADIDFLEALIITPIILVITMIPISIGGIGLSESAYFFTFFRMGLGGAVGLSVALLMRFKALFWGLIGGLYYSSMGIKIEQEIRYESEEKKIAEGDVTGEIKYYSGFEDVMRRKKSPLKKYMDIVLGHYGLWSLLKYELITFLFGPLPGLPGYFFRQVLYPFLLRCHGKGTIWGRNVSLRHPGKITIGRRCVIDEYCMLAAQGDENSAITLGDEVLLGRGTVLGTRNGQVEIGDFSNIGANCRLGTTTKIKLGKHVLFAANCYIGGAQHRFDRLDVPIMRQGYDSRGGVVIEDDAWLGAGVTVLDGVRIGTGSVIGAGSVVTKDIPPYSIAAGIPAKILGNRKEIKAE